MALVSTCPDANTLWATVHGIGRVAMPMKIEGRPFFCILLIFELTWHLIEAVHSRESIACRHMTHGSLTSSTFLATYTVWTLRQNTSFRRPRQANRLTRYITEANSNAGLSTGLSAFPTIPSIHCRKGQGFALSPLSLKWCLIVLRVSQI